MRRRRVWIVIAVAVSTLLGAGFIWLRLAGRPVITAADVARIQNGMTIQEVSHTLGTPPTRSGVPAKLQTETGWKHVEACRWESREGRIVVVVDEKGHVIASAWHDDEGPPSSFWKRLLWQLGL